MAGSRAAGAVQSRPYPFGREREWRELERILERVGRGSKEIVHLRGESGIGKTALVESLVPSLRAKGMFGAGKFAPGAGHLPYSAVMEALRDMIGRLLLLPAPQLERRRAAVEEALDGTGGLFQLSLPELVHIIGPQDPPPELPPKESEGRFQHFFRRLLEAFAADAPSLIFLDDLQWADRSSLALLKALFLAEPRPQGQLFLISYRTPAEAWGEDFRWFLEELGREKVPGVPIDVFPLDQNAVEEWVGSRLPGEDGRHGLAKAILEGTRGYPIHIRQYLDAILRHRYAEYDAETGGWILRFGKADLPQEVAPSSHLLALTLSNLAFRTRQAIEIASCAGYTFPGGLVRAAMGCDEEDARAALDEAVGHGLLVGGAPADRETEAFDGLRYAFSHDQVVEALQAGMQPERLQSIHHALGRILLGRPEAYGEDLFAVCYHLNRAHPLLPGDEARRVVLDLNLKAARKAKAAAAFSGAFEFYHAALSLLPATSWEDDLEFTRSVHLEASEAGYMASRYAFTDQWVAEIGKRTPAFLDRLRAIEIRIRRLIVGNDPAGSVDYALSELQREGVRFPDAPGKGAALMAILSVQPLLALKTFAALGRQASSGDPHQVAIARILSHINSAVFLTRPGLYPLLLIAQLRLSLRHGANRSTPFVYALYGLVLCGILRRYDAGMRFGKLALSLQDRIGHAEDRAKVLFGVYHFIHPWKAPLQETLPGLEEGLASALRTGDIEFAGHLANVFGMTLYHAGAPLASVHARLAEDRTTIAGIDQKRALMIQDTYLMAVASLRGESRDPVPWNLAGLPEQYGAGTDIHGTALAYLNRLILAVVFGEPAVAVASRREVKSRLESLAGTYFTGWFHFYGALALAAKPEVGYGDRMAITLHLRHLRTLARHAPGNYRHKAHLVEAHGLRLAGRAAAAMEAGVRAVEAARRANATDEESLAWEALFLLSLDRGDRALAGIYLAEQLACLHRWGAEAKARMVIGRRRAEFPQACRGATGIPGGESQELRKVLSVSRSIAAEADMDALLGTLLDSILEVAGAQRACLVSARPENFEILAEREAGNAVPPDGKSVPPDPKLPRSILRYCLRTGKTVNVEDVTKEWRFAQDPYFTGRPGRSVYCHSLQGPSVSDILLYLENAHAIGAFTSLDPWTEWLGGQAALSHRISAYHHQRMLALKAKLDPHFLYNVLTSISDLILREPGTAVVAVAKLSKLYRYMVEVSEPVLVSLAREMEMVKAYLAFEKLRFGEGFSYHLQEEEGLGAVRVPGLIVQLLVENAVKHGLLPKEGERNLWVTIREQGGMCRISVRDDGAGWGSGDGEPATGPEGRVRDTGGSGEGLRNIEERLRLAFGSQASLQKAARPGAEVILWLPMARVPSV